MSSELPKNYDPSEVEPRWYRVWLERRLFAADAAAPKTPFCIVLPPPNVTGSLHIGHALTATIQDVLVRHKRMSACNTLWLPGIDHAGIATQMVVERELAREGLTRHDLGRERFLQRVWAWKERSGRRIAEQHQRLGASLDWERERFTMDEQCSRAVSEAFVRLHEQGLIYRAERLIHWCPRCRTALSDLEVDNVEEDGRLTDFAYPIEGGGEIVVATTRPETMLGDTAVAVHPDDERYRALVGRAIAHPFVERRFPIVGDPVLVDPEFGTGAVKVTPAHDFNDFAAGARNRLPSVNILSPDGTLNEAAGRFAGMDRFEARKAVVEALRERGLWRGERPHRVPVPRCQRCATAVEPMLSMQWFVRTRPLAEPAIAAVESGKTRIVPEHWARTYFHWMRDIQDWCISRQLWWGHRIPAWFCPGGHVTVARQAPERCGTCGEPGLSQDEDVLDTWFSSALWPLSTLGWPEATRELRTFYPTSVMETGYDILFFWVARMMMMGLHFTGKVPFRTVLLHSMIVDERGEKMSKVKGNVIDPLDLCDRYGADSLRFALARQSTPAAQGRPIPFSEKRVEEARHFCTKLWNAARFLLMNLQGYDPDRFADAVRDGPEGADLGFSDRWILSRTQRAAREADDALAALRVDAAAQAAYRFVWDDLCDWAIEAAKPVLYAGSEGGDEQAPRARERAQGALAVALETALRLLHPFMPFVTEEICQALPRPSGAPDTLVITMYPVPDARFENDAVERRMARLQALVTELRNLRAVYGVPPAARPRAAAVAPDEETRSIVSEQGALVCALARVEAIETVAERPREPGLGVGGVGEVEVVLRLAGIVDVGASRGRFEKDLGKRRAERDRIQGRLATPAFVERAPAEVVDSDRGRVRELDEEIRRIERALASLA